MTIVGKAGSKQSYSGSSYENFTIVPKEITSLSVTGLKSQPFTGSAVDVQRLPIAVKAGGVLLTKDVDYTVESVKDCDYTKVTTSDIKKAGKQPKIVVKLREASATGRASEQPRVKWSDKAKEDKKTVTKDFAIVKAKLGSDAVSFVTNSNTVSENVVKSPDKTKTVGILRAAVNDEKEAGKNKFTHIIVGEAAELDKNVDVSSAAGLRANGARISDTYYTVTVSKTKNGKIGSITYKATKDAPYSGSRTIRFRYDSNKEEYERLLEGIIIQ